MWEGPEGWVERFAFVLWITGCHQHISEAGHEDEARPPKFTRVDLRSSQKRNVGVRSFSADTVFGGEGSLIQTYMGGMSNESQALLAQELYRLWGPVPLGP